jgi:AcrR family transcriptional regulator
MPRPRRISDAEMLIAARRSIQARGPQVTTRVLAQEIGISEGVIFQRFGSKEKLIAAALSPPEINVSQLLIDSSSGGESRQVLENIAAAIFRAFRELLPFYIPLMNHAETDREETWTSRGSAFQMFVEALEQHLKTERHAGRIWIESPHTSSYLIVSALHNAALFETIAGPSSSINEGFVRDLVGVIWNGLQPRKP